MMLFSIKSSKLLEGSAKIDAFVITNQTIILSKLIYFIKKITLFIYYYSSIILPIFTLNVDILTLT